MNITNKKLWQHAAGDTNRNYADLCLRWDVILIGPGDQGKWPECEAVLKKDGLSRKKINIIKMFAEDIDDGDIVVLRLGTTDILGVGVVVGPYEYLEAFSDVDGWDLQHVRRVQWLWKYKKVTKKFPTYAMKLGDTTQPLDSNDVIKWLQHLNILQKFYAQPLTQIPISSNNEGINYEEVSEYLFDKGVASNSIEALLKEIDELTRIAKWYSEHENPSEHETIAYLVVPLLRALGWTPQKMAIEWRNVDLALFSHLPRKDEFLSVVVEAKKKDSSCLTAKSQAQAYAQKRPNCQRLIVTDGIRYGVYVRNGNDFILHAYMNLIALKEEYPIYECNGIKEAFRAMTPEWSS